MTKFKATLILICISVSCFSQKPVQQFKSLDEIQRQAIKQNSLYSFAGNLYGGGLFTAEIKSNKIIDSGIVFPTSNPNIVLVRKMNDANVIKMDWFGIKDSIQNFMPAFKKATRYLETKGGGTISFNAGTYLAEPYFTIDANNIIVKGAGMNATFIKVSEKAGAGLMVNSRYRDAGWLLNTDDIITYKDDGLKTGQRYIDLKIKNDKTRLLPGTIIFINGGANYFDQNYGEFNIVDHCNLFGRVFLKYPLSRSYTENVSSWAATLTSNFTPPAEGSTATIYFSGTQPRGGTAISIGNNLYKVVSSAANSAVVMNVKNKGNSNAIIKSGTHIFKYRAIALTPGVVYNVSVSDMTVTGKRKSITVSNTFKTSFKNMRFNWLPQPLSPGGIWLDGDDGRDFKMSNCEINCPFYFSSQFARSFADIYIDYTTFNQAALQFTEFNINANVSDCIFNLSYNGAPGEVQQPAILLGNTCTAINFNNNTIHASNINNVFYSGEIQGYKALILSNININSNTITCKNIATLFSGAYAGTVNISNNKISGSVNFLFGVRAYNNALATNSSCRIMNNNFTGYVDGFGGAATNVQYINNTIKRIGAAKASNEYNVWGNVLYTHFVKDTNVVNFVCKDNTFSNWNLLHNSFSHYWPLNSKVNISNNHFYNSPKDTVVSLSSILR